MLDRGRHLGLRCASRFGMKTKARGKVKGQVADARAEWGILAVTSEKQALVEQVVGEQQSRASSAQARAQCRDGHQH